ncbi:LexA family protein [Tepidimicrobium xylanilyticum]
MLNKKESKLFDAIVKYIDENGYSPSIRELSEIVGFKSTSTVHRYLSKLEEKGYIERKENSSRALKVIKNNR